MKNRTSKLSIVTKVKQIIETDSVEAANIMLESGNWILLNSYSNKALGINPILRLGRIETKGTRRNNEKQRVI